MLGDYRKIARSWLRGRRRPGYFLGFRYPSEEPAPEPDKKEPQDQVGSKQKPEPVPESDALILPEPEQPGDPALITQPWVVVMMALAVLAVFGVVFGVVLGRERKLGANR